MIRAVVFAISLLLPAVAAADGFVWRVADIAAEVRVDRGPLHLGQYLHLAQRLRKGETGWTEMRIDIPERWSVQEVAIRDDAVNVVLRDGRRFRLDGKNVGALSFEILNDHVATDEALEAVWIRYAATKG
ncbi:MAG: hypothetical protein U1F48_05535 [Burkholderiales bacterium]